MVEIKTPGEVEAIRAAGKVVAEALAAVRAHAAAGMRLSELDEVARSVLASAGATSPFLGYKPSFAPVPFPAVICASLNDAALHGIPGRRRLAGRRPGQHRLRRDSGRLGGRRRDLVHDRAAEPAGRPADGRDQRGAAGRHRGGGGQARGSATSRRRSAWSAAPPGTGSTPTSAVTASAGPCTSRRRCRTRARQGVACELSPGLVIAIEPWFMAGGGDKLPDRRRRLDDQERPTGAAPRMPSTPSRLPGAARWC